MFDSIDGLPLHPLASHAAVVLLPLAGLLGLVFAVPRSRRWATVPLPLTALGAALAATVAVRSGRALQEAGGLAASGLGGSVGSLVQEHSELGNLLQILAWVYAALALLAAGVQLAITQRPQSEPRSRPLHLSVLALSVALVIGAVALGVQTYRVGELGARAVWNPAGVVDYSTDD